MSKINVISHTPMRVVVTAIRTAWNSHGLSDSDDKNLGVKDKALIDRIGNKYKHRSTLEHCVIVLAIADTKKQKYLKFFTANPYSDIITIKANSFSVSTNLRVLIENQAELKKILQKIDDTVKFKYLLKEL